MDIDYQDRQKLIQISKWVFRKYSLALIYVYFQLVPKTDSARSKLTLQSNMQRNGVQRSNKSLMTSTHCGTLWWAIYTSVIYLKLAKFTLSLYCSLTSTNPFLRHHLQTKLHVSINFKKSLICESRYPKYSKSADYNLQLNLAMNLYHWQSGSQHKFIKTLIIQIVNHCRKLT